MAALSLGFPALAQEAAPPEAVAPPSTSGIKRVSFEVLGGFGVGALGAAVVCATACKTAGTELIVGLSLSIYTLGVGLGVWAMSSTLTFRDDVLVVPALIGALLGGGLALAVIMLVPDGRARIGLGIATSVVAPLVAAIAAIEIYRPSAPVVPAVVPLPEGGAMVSVGGRF